MLICENEHLFEKSITVENPSERLECHGRECCLPKIEVCPMCKTDVIRKAIKCPVCGKYYSQNGLICPKCLNKHKELAYIFGYIIIKYSETEKKEFIEDVIAEDTDEFSKFIIETEVANERHIY